MANPFLPGRWTRSSFAYPRLLRWGRSVVIWFSYDDGGRLAHFAGRRNGALCTAAAVPLLERERVVAQLRALLRGASDGQARMVPEGGEAGIGKPFFLTHVLAAPVAGVPLSMREALLACLRGCRRRRQRAQGGAACGSRVDAWLLDRIAGMAAETLDACVEAGRLVSDRTYLVFRYDLLREAVLETASHRVQSQSARRSRCWTVQLAISARV
jgi:hypothetical protein